MSEPTVRIGLVLPDVMGTYGDGGNALVLRQRLRLRGIDAEVTEITLDDPVPAELDLYTLGGAEDYAQRLATKHLIDTAHKHNLAVHYWTINDKDEMRMLIGLGADGIMTDYPHRLAEVYAEYSK